MYKILILVILSLLTFSCAQTPSEKVVSFGICADVHLPTMHDSAHRISTFIDSMKAAQPDFIIELGDFGTPDEKYRPFFAIWNDYPGKKYHVIGNHEMDGGTSLEAALAYREMKSSYYTFHLNGFFFIVLDGNDREFPEQKGYRAFIGPEQQNWLKEQLTQAGEPVILFSHQAIGPPEAITNAQEIRLILENHNRQAKDNRVIASFNGHTHNDWAEEVNGIWYITINSMSYKWLGEEYAHIRYSDDIDRQFKWIKYTAPYKDPLFAIVTLSTAGYIRIKGQKSEYVGPSPWEVGYPAEYKPYTSAQIRDRELRFSLRK
jgi:3',5'-cyclic-AMP phosphodiesterase